MTRWANNRMRHRACNRGDDRFREPFAVRAFAQAKACGSGPVLVYAALLPFVFLALWPIVWALGISLAPLDEVYSGGRSLFASDAQWGNYREAASRLPLARFLLNSLFISGASVIGAVLTSSMAGYALARVRFRGRGWVLVAVLASMMVPGAVLLVPRFLLYDALGWVGTYKPLIVPAWLGGGAFNVLLFRQFFRTVPASVADAARLDGATPWQTYRFVLLPMVKPAVVAAAMLSFVYHWQSFMDPLIYLSDYHKHPISLGLRMYQSTSSTYPNLLMAVSLIALAPVAMMFFVGERWVMRGLGVEGGSDARGY